MVDKYNVKKNYKIRKKKMLEKLQNTNKTYENNCKIQTKKLEKNNTNKTPEKTIPERSLMNTAHGNTT